MKKIKRQLKSVFIFFSAIAVMMVIVLASYYNYRAIQDNVIEIEQSQLLSLANTVADSLERFFVNQTHNLEILAKNRYFISNYIAQQQGVITEAAFQNIEDYYSIQSDNIELIRLIDGEGEEIYTYPITDYGQGIEADFQEVYEKQKAIIGALYQEQDKLYINILQPVITDGHISGVLYVKIKLETIYHAFIVPVKAGEKGYSSVKDSDGALIMHPNTEDIGENVIEARTSAYPDFDWSELQELVEKQKRGESGVGIYHSLWFNDNLEKRVKKFSAFSPAQVGDDFWIVNVSKDYLEVVSFLKERTYNIIIINFFIILIFVTTLLYLYRVKKDQVLIAKEHALLVKVKELNEELEADIQQRIVLEKELIQSKNKFENIFEAGSDCIFVIDVGQNAQIKEVNLKVTQSLGYSKEQLLQMNYQDISTFITPEKLNEIKSDLLLHQSYLFEDILKGNQGKSIPVEINIKPMVSESTNQMVMISRDITMKKRFEEEMMENKRKEALMIYQSRLAAMGEMIGSIAHQWRQPLSGISMIFNNIEDAYTFEELDAPFLKNQGHRLQELIKYMSQTIDDFRFFFNPKNDKENFLMSKILDQTLDFLRESIRLNNIDVSMSLEKDILMLGRPNQLSQVLFGILKNAIDAIVLNNSEQRKISVRCGTEDQSVHLEIEDTGGGISEEKLVQIFEMYYTTKEAHNGTGLGLYIAKVIVEKNFDGEITAQNTQGGLCIVIKIPII
ncbi:ATP-binding protein [Fusibacter sp. 3D3]|uniref:ATP-binding protein n=1 Tax=Fusibacter sp. 3D3 TaxID=1048380 RepID=UPI000853032C|nr:ATP-binding protein [Fusibacter sp. 3D3]GAU78256.1 putative two-component sensor histidine kinase [Fusibacter sp. 3D3]